MHGMAPLAPFCPTLHDTTRNNQRTNERHCMAYVVSSNHNKVTVRVGLASHVSPEQICSGCILLIRATMGVSAKAEHNVKTIQQNKNVFSQPKAKQNKLTKTSLTNKSKTNNYFAAPVVVPVPVSVSSLRYSTAQMRKCANAQMLKCSNAPMLQCSIAQILKCVLNAQMLQCSNAPFLRYSNAY